MIRLIKAIVIVVLLLLGGLFAYDYYMTNSGLENRARYEKQKHDVKNSDYNPTKETFQEKRARKKKKRREKLKEFFN